MRQIFDNRFVLVLSAFLLALPAATVSQGKVAKQLWVDPCDFVGFTCVSCSYTTSVSKDTLKLKNEMTFLLDSKKYTNPDARAVGVFYHQECIFGDTLHYYKLLIDGEFYEATRVQ
jgi:hypothetical protein